MFFLKFSDDNIVGFEFFEGSKRQVMNNLIIVSCESEFHLHRIYY